MAQAHHHALDHRTQGQDSAPAPAPQLVRGRRSDPTHPNLHTPTKDHTMKLTHRIALAAAGLALTGSGVYIGATTPTPFDRVEAPTPTVSQTIPPVLQVATSEDDPR